jgi:hypothetical protein
MKRAGFGPGGLLSVSYDLESKRAAGKRFPVRYKWIADEVARMEEDSPAASFLLVLFLPGANRSTLLALNRKYVA